MLAIFSHPDCYRHTMGDAHPESPLRLGAVHKAIDELTAEHNIEIIRATPADAETLLNNHSRSYVDSVFAQAPSDPNRAVWLDGDTAMNNFSLQASLLAVGATVAAVDWAMEGRGQRAFCAIRPPGHHAEPQHAMGFCIFNNIAIAAHYALHRYSDCRRIAIIDFDVHHGNGTQSTCYANENLMFASSHQFPFYPGSGAEAEKGDYNNIINVPLAAHSGSAEFSHAYDSIILPAVRRFKPDLLMVSAGFDAHRDDPLAQINLDTEDYYGITEKLAHIADEFCHGRMVSVLEGGYNLQALYESSRRHLQAMVSM